MPSSILYIRTTHHHIYIQQTNLKPSSILKQILEPNHHIYRTENIEHRAYGSCRTGWSISCCLLHEVIWATWTRFTQTCCISFDSSNYALFCKTKFEIHQMRNFFCRCWWCVCNKICCLSWACLLNLGMDTNWNMWNSTFIIIFIIFVVCIVDIFYQSCFVIVEYWKLY